MHTRPCINALSLVTSSYLNVETEPRMNHVRFKSDIYAWTVRTFTVDHRSALISVLPPQPKLINIVRTIVAQSQTYTS